MDSRPAAFAAISDAVLAIASEHSAEPVLQRLVEAARQLVGARYAALGIPDGDGGFVRFLTVGMSQETIDAIGWLPRTHGMLGAMLGERSSFRTADITADPRFEGWPRAHPDMRSFLGVPIISAGEVVGSFYLTEKTSAAEFDDADQAIIELLAAHAAVAIDNVRLWERSREVTMLEEREHIARELHDAMSQTLFSLTLTAESAAAAVADDPDAALAHIRTVQQLARGVLRELRSLIVELRPADLESDGLGLALREHVELVRRAHHVDIEFSQDGAARHDRDVERELFRIAQEALHNAIRHSGAQRIELRLAGDPGEAHLVISDDGKGFDPAAVQLRSGNLGLTSMRHRARKVGGSLQVDSTPGQGTRISVTASARPRG